MKKLLFIILILGVATFGGMAVSRNVSGARGNKMTTVLSTINGQQLRKAELAIEGMWCVSCATGAEYSLKAIDGIEDAYVGFTDNLGGEGWVVYEKGKVTEEQIIQAVEPYKATIVTDTIYEK